MAKKTAKPSKGGKAKSMTTPKTSTAGQKAGGSELVKTVK
jgi:hypothetical protein